MKVAFYKGKSLVSKLIKFKTRGKYSHVAVMFDDDILEAWEKTNSVRYISDLSDGHTKGTEVDIFTIDAPVDEVLARKFADSQIGCEYSYWTIAQFLLYTSGDNPNKWICSEIALELVRKGGLNLLARVDAYKVSPTTLSWSPLLKFEKTIVTT